MTKKKIEDKKSNGKTIKVQLVKSFYGRGKEQIGTIRALGLRRLNDIKEHKDNDVIRGMIFKVKHLVKILD